MKFGRKHPILLNQPVENYNDIFYPPLTSRIYNVLLIGGIVLLLSCQSDSIVLNPPGGYEYFRQSFQLEGSNSFSVQGNAHTGYSPKLYIGILSNGDSKTNISTLISLLPQVIDSHQVCSADSIADVRLVLTSTIDIGSSVIEDDTTFIEPFIKLDSVKAYLISSPHIDEDAIITSDDLMLVSNLISEATSMPIQLTTNNSLEIDLFKKNNSIIDYWCNNQEELGILIDYSPTDSSHLEFYSSDSDEGPKLSLEYAVEEETAISYNYYSLADAVWSGGSLDQNDNGPHYIVSSLSEYWDIINIYAFNLKEDSQTPSPDVQYYDSLLFQDNIITNEKLNTSLPLLKINLKPNIEEFESIIFSLLNAVAFISDTDIAGDNIETNPDSTENNLAYDIGEKYNNYGLDNCPDELEDGEGGCVDLKKESSYNTGTEGNQERDWTDKNGNGKWDADEGEMWGDWGFDWCPDSLEDGSGGCLSVPDILLGYDPNEDNVDPKGDDWHEINNPDSTEGNQKWDSGEPFNDWGSDGLSVLLVGEFDINGSEGNLTYDIGEPFEDTGSDGLFNIDESGYNIDRTEGNNKFDGDGEFNDCGDDNCCDLDADLGKCDDAGDDNFNTDPNNDNWSVENSIGTEGNNQLDLINGSSDGLWTTGDGEEWFDWGTDGIPDSLEAFQVSAIILPNLYDNNYVFDFKGGLLQELPALVDSTVNLWISKIEKTTDNELTIDISIHSNVALKGLQFQLSHTPYTKVDTVFQIYESSIMQIGTEKLFEDLSLLPKKMYSEEELKGKLLIDYANDVTPFLDFDSLDLFLEDGENIISHEYSNLILYVDSVNTNLYDDMEIFVVQENSSGEDMILSPPIFVSSLDDSITIPMGYVLRAYQSGKLDVYDKFQLKTGGNLNNYSQLSIKNNPRLDIMFTK